MASAKKIEECLKGYGRSDLELMFSLVSDTILRNIDFVSSCEQREDDIASSISQALEEDGASAVNFDIASILTGDSLSVYKSLEAEEMKYEMENESDGRDAKGNLRKGMLRGKGMQLGKMRKLIAGVFADPVLFEGFFLTLGMDEQKSRHFFSEMGCAEEFDALFSDPVFRRRYGYGEIIRCYAAAAVNLYGVLSVSDLADIIWEYEEKLLHKREDYSREGGSYPHTLHWSPKYFCAALLTDILDSSVPGVLMTMDGLLLNEVFKDELEKETEKLLALVGKKYGEEENDGTGDAREKEKEHFKNLDSFFESESNCSFRRLYETAAEKPLYYPSQDEFLKYADAGYYDDTAFKKYREFLLLHYGTDLRRRADPDGVTVGHVLAVLMDKLRALVTDHRADWDNVSMGELIQKAADELNKVGIALSNDEEINVHLRYFSDIWNSQRLWANGGNTPMELAAARRHMNRAGEMAPASPSGPTIMPMSSFAAKFMEENRETIESTGAKIDLDSNALHVPSFHFPEGINGPMIHKVRKVYPNDPCPCGSGLKYKNCCGRKKSSQ